MNLRAGNFGGMRGFHPHMKALMLLMLCCTCCAAKTISDLAYGDHPRQKLDLHLPDGEATAGRPVVIGIHGGAWRMGNKAHPWFIEPKAEWFNGKGFLFVSVNYRLSPEVAHPEHVSDVCSAIAWVQKHIATHGGNPEHLILLGHSAGAHLAALATVDHNRLKAAGADPGAIKGAILLDGACYDAPRQIANASAKRMWVEAFTRDPEVQRDASPTFRAADLDVPPPPFLILHVAGRRDSKAQSDGLAKALRAKGGVATVVPVAGKTHSTINRDLGKPGDATTRAVASFLGI